MRLISGLWFPFLSCLYDCCICLFCVAEIGIVLALSCRYSSRTFEKPCILLTHVFFFGADWVRRIYYLREVPSSYFPFVGLQEILLLHPGKDVLLSHHADQPVYYIWSPSVIMKPLAK